MTTGMLMLIALVTSGAVLALLMAIGQLLIPNRNRGNKRLFFIYLNLALITGYGSIKYAMGPAPALPHLALYFPLPRLIIAPMVLLYLREMVLEKPFSRFVVYAHFTPAAVLGAFMAPFFCLDILRAAGVLARDSRVTDFFPAVINWAGFATNFYLLIYFGPLVLFVLRVRPDIASGRSMLRAVAVLLTAGVLILLLNIFNFFLENFVVNVLVSLLVTFVMFCIFLMSYRFPELLHVMRMEAFEQSRSSSPLKGMDTDELNRKLQHLMEEEKLHADEDLDLKTVARALDIRPYQLTYFLNHTHEKSFTTFVNEHRVAAAKAMLIDEPERSALSIGYAAGFNSKSTFYRVFYNETGSTPHEFRKKAKG